MRLFLMTIILCIAATVSFAQGSYLVKPGDTLQIEVLEDPSLNRTVIVLPDGRFSFPFAGTVQAGGRTLGQVERGLTAAIASNFTVQPSVFISVANLRPETVAPGALTTAPGEGMSVFFLGEVGTPGEKVVSTGSTFLQALSASGGFTNFAAHKRIQILRRDSRTGQQQIFTVNYKAMTEGAGLQGNIVLREGDVVLVPERRLFE